MKYFSLLLLSLCLALAAQAQRTLIHCGQLLDVNSEKLLPKRTLIIEGNTIKAVEKGYTPAEEADQYIDLKKYTVMPGLMDMHVHMESETSPTKYSEGFRMNDADMALRATRYAYTTLMAGFTTVRDLGGTGINISLRNAINKGWVVGPRIYTAGKAIATTGGHADPTSGLNKKYMGDPGPAEGVINGPEEARKAVRQAYKNGSDLIKITATGGVLSVAKDGSGPQFTPEELEAIISTAKDYGMRVAAHAHGDEGMRRAVEAGITSIEHGTLMSDETMGLMKDKGTYYVPTLTAGRTVADSAKIEGYYPEIVVPKALAIGPQIQETFARAYKKGVKIAFGTDAAVFKHGLNAKEFGLMVEAGMPEMETLISATKATANLLGIWDKAGSLEAGKWADVVAVPGDPTQDISLMEKVEFVMKEGKVYKMPEDNPAN